MSFTQHEEEILAYWEKHKVFEQVEKHLEEATESFNTVEGPPFPTGSFHVGHALIWTVKDTIFRYQRLLGKKVYVRDGYDVHGLPVTVVVQKQLGLESVDDIVAYGIENFIQACKEYVDHMLKIGSSMRSRFGFWLNSDYYHTSHPEYMSLMWQFFKKAHDKQLLYRGKKTVAWCPKDETTLSDYEIKDTYAMLEDPSVYVRFKLEETKGEYPEYLLIWTTTPWTLQSNIAIAVHPEYLYARVLVERNGKKEVYIVAESLVEDVCAILAKSNALEILEVIETFPGATLKGTKYVHVLLEETPTQQEMKKEHPHVHEVITAEFVTLGESNILDKLQRRSYKHSITGEAVQKKKETSKGKKSSGTGLVHIAPGHGTDDFDVGMQYQLPIFCPVNEKGVITEGKFAGQYFKDANPHVVSYLEERGDLLYHTTYKHNCPLCWRCKTPILFRAQEQWWIRREQMKQSIIEDNQQVHWYPEHAREQFNYQMGNSRDWPISRQQFWSTPLPIWEDKETGEYLIMSSKEELEKYCGQTITDLHLDVISKISFIHEGKTYTHVGLVSDVWLESGCASFASHYNEGLTCDEIVKQYMPIDFIVEGEDQITGWFSSLFSVGKIMTDKAPYEHVITLRHVKDKDGMKMGKSLGNGITMEESIDTLGADGTRLYIVSKCQLHEDIHFNIEEAEEMVRRVQITLDNVFKFMNAYLKELKYVPLEQKVADLNIEDQWILYQLHTTITHYHESMKTFDIHRAVVKLNEFLDKSLSKTYLKYVKERVDAKKLKLTYVFSHIMKVVSLLYAPIMPFKAEQLYQNAELQEKKASVFLEAFPEANEAILALEEKVKAFDRALDIIQTGLFLRDKYKIGVRWPLSYATLYCSQNELKQSLVPVMHLIKSTLNIKELHFDTITVHYEIKPNFKAIKEREENDFKEIVGLVNAHKEALIQAYNKQELPLIINKKSIGEELLLITPHIEGKENVVRVQGDIFMSLHTEQTNVLLEEGYIREIMRRIQILRKEQGLDKKDSIMVSFEGSDSFIIRLVNEWKKYLSGKVNAIGFVSSSYDNTEHIIKDKKVSVGIKKI